MTGFIVQAINNNLAPLLFVIFQDEFGLNLSSLSTVILVNFLTQLCVDAFAGKITDKFGFRFSVLAAMACSASTWVTGWDVSCTRTPTFPTGARKVAA